MASTAYQCIVCQQSNVSIMDLHNHQVQYHTPEELSLTVLNLQGLHTFENSMIIKDRTFTNVKQTDNYVIRRTKKQGKVKSRYSDIMSLEDDIKIKQVHHDQAHCLANCSEFIAWENELNKLIKIEDDEFFSSIDELCNDLQRCKSRKKRSYSTKINKVLEKVKNVETVETQEVLHDKNLKVNSQKSLNTVLLCNQEQTNLGHDTILESQSFETVGQNEIKSEHKEPGTRTYIELDLQENILLYDHTSRNLSYSPLAVNSYLKGFTYSEETSTNNEFRIPMMQLNSNHQYQETNEPSLEITLDSLHNNFI